eukprot:TRINITY_DN687_c0_g2_i3.p1 TRINITY_DN687_c0_g2~~TRINITY_DN687_c0_g2_i3.p1  ORF type:complete len:755 (+),score=45.93 TRINITY_DN687_c0_g2_i3:109-2373(+)
MGSTFAGGGATVMEDNNGVELGAQLNAAVRAGHLDLVAVLLSRGASPNVIDPTHNTNALGTAVATGHVAAAKLLASHATAHNTTTTTTTTTTDTPLHTCARRGDEELATFFIRMGCANLAATNTGSSNQRACDVPGLPRDLRQLLTPLAPHPHPLVTTDTRTAHPRNSYWYCDHCNKRFTSGLTNYCAQCDYDLCTTCFGQTLSRATDEAVRGELSGQLLTVASEGQVDQVCQLLYRGATAQPEAVVSAVANGHLDVVRVLLSHPSVWADLTGDGVGAQRGRTILHQAVRSRSEQPGHQLVRLLLSFDRLDPTLPDDTGQTARDVAGLPKVRTILSPIEAHQHELALTDPQTVYARFSGAWSCDHCRERSSTDSPYHCHTCEYDLCRPCYSVYRFQRLREASPSAGTTTTNTTATTTTPATTSAAATLTVQKPQVVDTICLMCRTARADATNVPCGHTLLCITCNDDFRRHNGPICNVCRQPSQAHRIVSVLEQCAICMDDQKPASELFCLGRCGHVLCIYCTVNVIRTALADAAGQFPVRCPANTQTGPCPGQIGLQAVEALVTVSQRIATDPAEALTSAELDRFNLFNNIAAISPEHRTYCPRQECGGLIIVDAIGCQAGENGREVACPYCRHIFCQNCKEAWHQGVSCDDAARDARERTQETNALILDTAKRCPSCRIAVTHYRNHGCHHIAPGRGCPGCGHHFCYACLGPYPCRRCRLFCNNDCGCPICPDCRPGVKCSLCSGCPACKVP